ncbi:hypothetical protein CIT292_06587 [Citrobacter youngae ATCC 29220]|uniref:Uncharacterized protein n=1 Tax=Citrobacter youngae ATCC 29220 TaxID=500640 RepID=D4B7R4_9ENTR|nr:hypothetical protein CIT292_06587 [Citrobacter youngae ATCC 29220]
MHRRTYVNYEITMPEEIYLKPHDYDNCFTVLHKTVDNIY